jgi:hypothetical protein
MTGSSGFQKEYGKEVIPVIVYDIKISFAFLDSFVY